MFFSLIVHTTFECQQKRTAYGVNTVLLDARETFANIVTQTLKISIYSAVDRVARKSSQEKTSTILSFPTHPHLNRIEIF